MLTDTIKIEILDHHWVQGDKDDPDDLCSHGYVFVGIGSEVICNQDTLDVTTSAASLHLMRTLDKDYTPGSFAGQLLPCCGHFMVASDDLKTVDLHSCNSGIDWHVIHMPDGYIKLLFENGIEAIITFKNYKDQVLAFADDVKSFYNSSSPKNKLDDDFDRNGYIAFWNEWHSLRNKWI